MTNKPIRHGEVMLYPIKSFRGATKQHDSFIVGHSETGHHHVLQSDTSFDVMTNKEKDQLYIRLFKPGKLVHRKSVDAHNTLDVPAGNYRVIKKTEYDPWAQVMRGVFD